MTIAAITAQAYESVGPISVVGSADSVRSVAHSSGVRVSSTLAEAVEGIGPTVEYIWFIAEGAVPRPDALRAAVLDADRIQAGVIGSKILSGSGMLHSVGLVTDVFGVPYTGLDRSERDQGQHDVVREVAAVSGTALLVRRDLLHGLGGVDAVMAPGAAAIDLAQRARLKGARVAVSPASEVVFDVEEPRKARWREDAGRIRAMLKVYSPLTLSWVIPLDFLIGLLEVVVSVFLGRWRGTDFLRAWGWNVGHLPSTISGRRHALVGRASGDEELFRFQRRGSVKVARLWKAVMASLRSRLPGDDRVSISSLNREMRQPAFVVGALTLLFVLLAARNLWADGFPTVGYTFGFPTSGSDTLRAYAGGWNPAGLGSPDPLRPLLAIAGVVKLLTLDAPSLGEYLIGAGSMLAGIWGMMRLLRTWSISAVPGLVAGIVYMAGPAAQGIAGNTHIGTLLALGVLPWVLRVVLKPVGKGVWASASRVAAAILTFGLLGALSPLLLLVPVPLIAVLALFRFTDVHAWRGLALSIVGTAGGALLLSPWIWSANFARIAREGYAFWHLSGIVAVAGIVVAVAGVAAARGKLGIVAGWGALLVGVGVLGSRSGAFGLGYEAESIALVVLSLGAAVSIGVVAQSVADPEGGGWRRIVMGVGSVGIVFLMVASITILVGGRIGLPADRFDSAFEFTLATEGEAEISRILVVGPPELLPGDSRMIQGGAYRVVSAPVPDLGEARLGHPLPLDEALEQTLAKLISGESKRAGGELASFGVRWIVVMGESEGLDAHPTSRAWRNVFAGQLDLLPLTAAVENTVWVTDVEPVARAITSSANPWPRTGWTYSGEPEPGRRVYLAENPDEGWGPGPRVTTESIFFFYDYVCTEFYTPDEARRTQAVFVLVAIAFLIGVTGWGRRRT